MIGSCPEAMRPKNLYLAFILPDVAVPQKKPAGVSDRLVNIRLKRINLFLYRQLAYDPTIRGSDLQHVHAGSQLGKIHFNLLAVAEYFNFTL